MWGAFTNIDKLSTLPYIKPYRSSKPSKSQCITLHAIDIKRNCVSYKRGVSDSMLTWLTVSLCPKLFSQLPLWWRAPLMGETGQWSWPLSPTCPWMTGSGTIWERSTVWRRLLCTWTSCPCASWKPRLTDTSASGSTASCLWVGIGWTALLWINMYIEQL